ncbi:GNAT family N-acetyltransferase [Glycomyces sp. TRM65418]|uniref:GNAT family N-acetyltransferase n=1 Tax=Glycomyces sp. TRM65418 TaxID=2867006 RepID=UPI001CE51797|nr:GNAT family N-acetyltransferase [Glycomyces sp. TRM65418]MCC3762869.1 GNAT family N-acetyltransferase [Glycomyces sp. TRM65418]QZD56896.1 GNAT family N-acetyltransferase [Glycomyces sp. TRM65418]
MSDIDIIPIDPLDAEVVGAWIAMQNAVIAHDRPGDAPYSPSHQRLRLLLHASAVDVERYAARLDGVLVGSVELVFYLTDNQHLVSVELEVHPDCRRRGVGTRLVEFVEQRAAERGRDTLLAGVAESVEGGPAFDHAGREFAKARGYASVDNEIHRRNDLFAVEDDDLAKLYADAWAKAAGYELIQWVNHAPDDIVEGIAAMRARMYTDPPMGEELDIRPAVYDVARVRDEERVRADRGELQLAAAVRHVESGEVAGLTDILVPPGSETHAGQNDTIVDPSHRGRRLGTILKIANQRLLREYRPKLRYVHTWNAESNAHMIAINEAVGYRRLCRDIDVQKKLTK